MSNPTIKEILEANRESKPSEIDKIPVKKNTVKGRSADANLDRILPSKEEQFKTAEKLTPLFDTTRRAGAGGTKAGSVGIRPSGGKAASEFLDNFTGTGRMTPQKEDTRLLSEQIKPKHVEGRQANAVIYDKCQDCMKPARKDNVQACIKPLPPGEHMHDLARAKWAAVGIKPGMIIGYFVCMPCFEDAMKRARELNYTGLTLVIAGQNVTAGQRYMKERAERIDDNLFASIRKERNNPTSECFYGEAVIE